MSTTVDTLELEIRDNSKQAVSGLDALASTLERIKTISKGGLGLTTGVKQIQKLNQALSSLNTSNLAVSKIAEIVKALKPLENLQKTNLNSTLNALKKLPEMSKSLETLDLNKFSKQIISVTNSLKPLATEMSKISAGFNSFPTKIQKLISANSSLSTSNTKLNSTYGALGTGISSLQAKFGIYYVFFQKMANLVSGWLTNSNAYIENLNLFTVAMGQYSSEALSYAQKVQSAMGIDMSEWIRNQGIFMQIATGFGVVQDKAYDMSRGLTQIAYDMSSYFNADISTALEKVQSGISGELEPLRRWGYALDQATLQQVAYAHGITMSMNKMTQAQKSQIRYIAIMEQSKNVMGDMSRTIVTPANALRILNQQFTQLERAMGNLILPLLIKILPYMNAFVKVLTETINELASFFGFELPTIDYSSLQGLSTGADDATSSLSDATDAANKLKNATIGIDEINVLSNTSTKTAGATNTSNDLGLDLSGYDYDFLGGLSDQVNGIYDKIKPIGEKIVKFVEDNIGTIKNAIIGLGVAKLAWSAWGVISSLWSKFKGYKIVDSFLDGFSLIKARQGNLFQSTKGGLDNIRANLSTTQKSIGSIIALTAEFLVVETTIKNLVKGNLSVKESLLILIPVITAAGVAMYTMLGPWGLVLTTATALVAAFVGANTAYSEMIDNTVKSIFYNSGMGISITTIADAFDDYTSKIVNANQTILTNQDTIEGARTKVEDATTSIYNMSNSIAYGAYTASEKIPEIVTQFETLRDNTKTILDTVYNNIMYAISGSLGQALIDAGYNVNQIVGVLAQVKGETDTTFADLVKQQQTLSTEYANGKITADDYSKKLIDLSKKMQTLSGDTGDYLTVFDDVKNSMGNINWEDDKAKKNFFSSVESSAKTAKDSINDSYTAIKNNIDTMRGWSSNPSYQLALDQILLGAKENRDTQLANVKSQVSSIYTSVQQDIITKTKSVKEAAVKEWNDKSWWEKLWSGSDNEADYVNKYMTSYQKNVVSPVSKSIDTSMKTLGIDGTSWAKKAMDKILKSLFEINTYSEGFSSGTMVSGYKSSLTSSINKALNDVGVNTKGTAKTTGGYVSKGVAEGISNNTSAITSSITQAANSTIATWDSITETHSPSKVFERRGSYVVSGIANGISNNIDVVQKSVVHMFNVLLDKMEDFSNNCRDAMNDLLKELAKSVTSVKISSKGKVTFTALADVKLAKMYGSGGFPDTGEMFIANEAGPEMVGRIGNRSAVANSNQIVEGIAVGVADANQEQNALLREQNNLLRKLLAKDPTVEAYVTAGSVVDGLRQYNLKEGKTIVPVGT